MRGYSEVRHSQNDLFGKHLLPCHTLAFYLTPAPYAIHQKIDNLWHEKEEDFFCVWLLKHITTAQKMKFSIKDFFSKCDRIRRKLLIWSHLLKKSLMENFIF